MKDFKVGDKVVIMNNHHSGIDNEIGVIVSFSRHGNPYVTSPSIGVVYPRNTDGAAFDIHSLRHLTPLEELL